jgi:hypothetical protein
MEDPTLMKGPDIAARARRGGIGLSQLRGCFRERQIVTATLEKFLTSAKNPER